jgi:hypothetical protein
MLSPISKLDMSTKMAIVSLSMEEIKSEMVVKWGRLLAERAMKMAFSSQHRAILEARGDAP